MRAYISRTMPTQHKNTSSQPAAPPLPAPLSPHWAFVVQLQTDTALDAPHLHGRIEHLVSGQAATFASLEELRTFMEQVLRRKEEQRP